MYCEKCGHNIDGSAFCPQCGHMTNAAAQSAYRPQSAYSQNNGAYRSNGAYSQDYRPNSMYGPDNNVYRPNGGYGLDHQQNNGVYRPQSQQSIYPQGGAFGTPPPPVYPQKPVYGVYPDPWSFERETEKRAKISGALWGVGVVFPLAILEYLLQQVLNLMPIWGNYLIMNLSPFYCAASALMVAACEELCKFLCLTFMVKKYGYKRAYTCAMAYSLSFGILESVLYVLLLGVSPLLRLIAVFSHLVFGMYMGHFYRMHCHFGNPDMLKKAVLIPLVLHALYDYTPFRLMGYQEIGFEEYYDNIGLLVLVFIAFVIAMFVIAGIKRKQYRELWASIEASTGVQGMPARNVQYGFAPNTPQHNYRPNTPQYNYQPTPPQQNYRPVPPYNMPDTPYGNRDIYRRY